MLDSLLYKYLYIHFLALLKPVLRRKVTQYRFPSRRKAAYQSSSGDVSSLPLTHNWISWRSQAVFSDPSISTPGLQSGNNTGYEPLRRPVSSWLASFYDSLHKPEWICITGGASQSLSVILQVLTYPLATKTIWMVALCFYLVCRIFKDAGFTGTLRAVRETDEGIDIEFLEQEIVEVSKQESTKLVSSIIILNAENNRLWWNF